MTQCQLFCLVITKNIVYICATKLSEVKNESFNPLVFLPIFVVPEYQ